MILRDNITFQGDFTINLKSHFQKLLDNRQIKAKANNFELYFENNDLEKIEDKLNINGCLSLAHHITRNH